VKQVLEEMEALELMAGAAISSRCLLMVA